jgi:hypothetical protein
VNSLRIRWLEHAERVNNKRMPKMILNDKNGKWKEDRRNDGLTASNVTLNVWG